MKFLHTGDLHIGKKLFETSISEDQQDMLEQIRRIAEEERIDALVVAGDVYDRAVPGTEAVVMLDDFLTGFVQKEIPVLLISGNHDSPERLGFAGQILEKQGLHIAGIYEGSLKKVTLPDAAGEVCFVCMPFVKPAAVGAVNSADAVKKMLEREQIDFADGKRYVLITHFFVTGEDGAQPELSESETGVEVGGLDNVPAGLFRGFCYVALGHIHKAQQIRCETPIFYCGAPMKYSFSEADSEKSVNIVELAGDGSVQVRRRKLRPLHEMRCIRGRLQDLMRQEIIHAEGVSPLDYLQATLTDREELINPMATLRSVYPNMLQILFEKNYTGVKEAYESGLCGARKGTKELFADFYEMLTGETLDEGQRLIVAEAAEAAEGEDNL